MNRFLLHSSLVCSLFSASALQASESVFGALNADWQAYIAAELKQAAGVSETKVTEQRESALARALGEALRAELNTTLRLSEKSSFNAGLKSGYSSLGAKYFDGLGLLASSSGFAAREQFTPSIAGNFGSAGEFSIGSVLVFESLSNRSAISTGSGAVPRAANSSSGTGIIAGWQSATMDSSVGPFSLSLSAQSRIDMDAYRGFVGVFSTAADFDLPARVGSQMHWDSGIGRWSVGVERVNYAKVQAFTDTQLPDQFVSLLGDSGSPQFTWRNLDVYSLSYELVPSRNDVLSVSLTTSQQPVPESFILRNALNLSRKPNMAVNYIKQLSSNARVRLATTYAPDAYFFGPNLLSERDFSGQPRLEGEASFEVRF
jgi:hypothetical protein